jgi:hypothetical protein
MYETQILVISNTNKQQHVDHPTTTLYGMSNISLDQTFEYTCLEVHRTGMKIPHCED